MKQSYKIKTQNTELPDEQILKHKNFEEVFARYKSIVPAVYKTPLYKNPKLFMGLFLAGTIAVLVWLAVKEESNLADGNANQTEVIAEANEWGLIDWNFPHDHIQNYGIAKGGKLEWAANGMRFRAPANAFEFTDGRPAKGDISIEVVRITSPMELMGVSMGWNKGETQIEMAMIVPAGAFHISAQSEGEEVRLKKGVQMEVQLNAEMGFQKFENLHAWKNPRREKWSVTTIKINRVAANENKWDGFAMLENGQVLPPHNENKLDTIGNSVWVKLNIDELGYWAVAQINHSLSKFERYTFVNENGNALNAAKAIAIAENAPYAVVIKDRNSFQVEMPQGWATPGAMVVFMNRDKKLFKGTVQSNEGEKVKLQLKELKTDYMTISAFLSDVFDSAAQ
jgi:hypothetical protein